MLLCLGLDTESGSMRRERGEDINHRKFHQSERDVASLRKSSTGTCLETHPYNILKETCLVIWSSKS